MLSSSLDVENMLPKENISSSSEDEVEYSATDINVMSLSDDEEDLTLDDDAEEELSSDNSSSNKSCTDNSSSTNTCHSVSVFHETPFIATLIKRNLLSRALG